jgi:hypothetical protein
LGNLSTPKSVQKLQTALHACQIASNCDPHFACKSDPFGAAETGGAKPYIAEQSRSRRAVSGEREVMRGS